MPGSLGAGDLKEQKRILYLQNYMKEVRFKHRLFKVCTPNHHISGSQTSMGINST